MAGPQPDSMRQSEQTEQKQTSSASHDETYSLFTAPQKKWIVVMAASAGWLSTASSFIYFPAIPFLARDLAVSVEKINLTVTSYLIASGIFPAFTGSAADRFGRRPVLVAALAVYILVNIGLALQRSFAVLFVLRMLQSAAISGTYSVAYGVIGDLVTPAERGGYSGVLSFFLNTSPSVAPLISGLLLIRWTWPSIFWFLSILSPVIFFSMVFLLPETCRNVVGNGSLPAPLINRPLLSFLSPPRLANEGAELPGRRGSARFPNPIMVFALLKRPGTLVAVLCFALYYTIYSCLQASLSTIFVDVYHVTGLVAGLVYIPFGVGCAVGAFFGGQLLNWDYRQTAKRKGMRIDARRGDDLSKFPIEHARLRSSKYFIAVCAPLIAGYGWTLQTKTHMAVPLTLQFFMGFTNQVLFVALNTLMVDFHSDQPSSIQAASNLVRSELAAVGLAVLDVMLRNIGAGWSCVVFAALHLITLPALWVLESQGPKWRHAE